MSDVCEKNFKEPVLELPEGELIEEPPMLLFGDFINPSLPKEMRVYKELPDMEKLMAVLKVSYSLRVCDCDHEKCDGRRDSTGEERGKVANDNVYVNRDISLSWPAPPVANFVSAA